MSGLSDDRKPRSPDGDTPGIASRSRDSGVSFLRRRVAGAFWGWGPSAVAVAAFGVDLVTPRAITDIYVLAIFACLGARSSRVPVHTAALSSALMIVGFFLSPLTGSTIAVAAIDRGLTFAVIWVGALLTVQRLNSAAVVERAQAAARQSERRFRVMADGVPAIIWVTDVQGRIEFVNREYCDFFGETQDEAQRQGWRPHLHQDDAAAYIGSYREALERQVPFNVRVRVRHRSGAWRWLETSGVPRFSENGAFLGHVGLSPDVTAVVETQEALKEADRRKDQFLAVLSHELRNPLAPIRSAAAILAAPALTSQQIEWAQSVIQRQVEHMATLLNDLLDLTRIVQGKLKLSLERVSLSSVADAAIEAARPSIDAKRHQLLVSLPAGASALWADPLRLSQVFSNLLTNAAKYTDPGGHIEFTGRVEDGMVRVSVKDDGIGIPPEAFTGLFKMFSQLEDAGARSEGGMGIGLALAKGLVELQGGTIEARSAGRGRGSEFIVRLPLAMEPNPEAPDRVELEHGKYGRRVLVADDNRDAADSLALLLTKAGCEVRVAYDGFGAVALARAFHPQIAVLDIGMPGLDGYAAARELRREPQGGELLLIALTGWGQKEDKRLAAAAGFDAHLVKPADPERLVRLMLARDRAELGRLSRSPAS